VHAVCTFVAVFSIPHVPQNKVREIEEKKWRSFTPALGSVSVQELERSRMYFIDQRILTIP
jgi:hypothetical protein